ncbi:MAG TPA: glycerol-3-phosphate 1-O-acyltransferase PlsY [Desulfuromonadales bacterium]|nr:glycerol-3-phosphate 1-O-acyltransferase PlsY [Desulfuromonadales bacterium]
MISFVLTLIAAYLIGSIPTGVVLTRLSGAEDVRKSGSGNIGATNVYRVAGRRLGILTLLGDVLKGLVPLWYLGTSFHLPDARLALVAAALFLGHLYPIYLRFKGGKGVATALGVLLVLSPLAIVPALLIFAGVLWRWRYVSAASVSAAASIPLLVWLFERSLPTTAAALFIAVMVIVRHRVNIKRLLDGTENRFKA